jgi:hypothetical protein
VIKDPAFIVEIPVDNEVNDADNESSEEQDDMIILNDIIPPSSSNVTDCAVEESQELNLSKRNADRTGKLLNLIILIIK